MSMSKERKPAKQGAHKRRYPSLYEKAVPLALAVIGIAIVLLLIVIFAVALGFFPGS